MRITTPARAHLNPTSKETGRMDLVPAIKSIPFEQLEPGELFICADARNSFYALRTDLAIEDGSNTLVLLGPSFPQDIAESFLIPWRPAGVLSIGRKLAVLPSMDSAHWSLKGPSRTPVCLAVAGGEPYICTNGGPSLQHYLPCFVSVRTGAIVEGRLPGPAAFTSHWEIAALSDGHPPRTVLKYPQR
jgi:hypothetical protein